MNASKVSRETAPPVYIEPVEPGTWRLRVWVQPGAGENAPAGEYRSRLKIKLTAPPVDNKANKALVAFVAKRLHLRKNQVELVSGQTSRQKNLLVRSDSEPRWDAIVSSS